MLAFAIFGLTFSAKTLALIALGLTVFQNAINAWKTARSFLARRARRLEQRLGLDLIHDRPPPPEISVTIGEIDRIVLKPKG